MIYNINNEVICDYNCSNCVANNYCPDKIVDNVEET